MVEGFGAEADYSLGDRIRIAQDVGRKYAQHFDALASQPSRTRLIPLRTITGLMRKAINLDRQLGGGAVEIEDVGADRMLLTKANIGAAEPHPQKPLG